MLFEDSMGRHMYGLQSWELSQCDTIERTELRFYSDLRRVVMEVAGCYKRLFIY